MSSSSDLFQNSFDSYQPKQELESPFLNEEFLVDEARIAQWRVPATGVQLESPFLEAFEEGWRSSEVEEFVDEFEDYKSDELESEERWQLGETEDEEDFVDELEEEEFDELQEYFDNSESLLEFQTPQPRKQDYSLKAIATTIYGKVPIKVLDEILTRGNIDVDALTSQIFWERHPDLNGVTLDRKNQKQKKLSDEWSKILNYQIEPLIWFRRIVEMLDRHRGDIPREFLLGWMAVESDGNVKTITRLGERGYFQVHPSEAREQLKLSDKDFSRLSSDLEYSIQMGVNLAQIYRRHYLDLYQGKLTDGTELLWHLIKAHHGLPSTLKAAMAELVKKGKDITWCEVSLKMSNTKLGTRVVNNVNQVFCYALLLKPIADLIPSSPAPTPEMFTPSFKERWEAINDEFSSESEMEIVSYEQDEFELLHEQPLEERLEPSTIPKEVADALRKKNWPLALKLAIQAGWRDEKDLTNLIFSTRHTERLNKLLDKKDPEFKKLSAEWTQIRDTEVRIAIRASAVTAVKKTKMPMPTKGQDSIDVHAINLPLFHFTKRQPNLFEVKQAPGLANCPVASILAALAFTAKGKALLQKMLTMTAAPTLTDISGVKLSNPPSGATLDSYRFFTVQLPGGPVDVSDILYTDDHDDGWSPIYMRDPYGKSIWAAIIEKALAVQLGSYGDFNTLGLTGNDFWEKIVGTKPGGFEIKDDMPLTKIYDAAKTSKHVPSIAASKPNDTKVVTGFHGFAMLGLEGNKIKLYDPAKANTLNISPSDFRHDFQAILFHK